MSEDRLELEAYLDWGPWGPERAHEEDGNHEVARELRVRITSISCWGMTRLLERPSALV